MTELRTVTLPPQLQMPSNAAWATTQESISRTPGLRTNTIPFSLPALPFGEPYISVQYAKLAVPLMSM